MRKSIVQFSRLFHPHIGGVETHVQRLSEELIKRGHEVTVITSQYEKNLRLEDEVDGIKILRIPYQDLQSKTKVWKYMMTKSDLLENADVIHIHDVFWWYMSMKLKLFRKPVYTTFHGYEPGDLPPVKNKVHRKIVEIMSSKTVCVGDFMRKWYWAKPDMVVYGASDLPKIRKTKKRLAVFIGRLEADTGIFAYLRAMLELKDEWVLDIYGEGPEQAEIERIVRRNKLKVRLQGWTNTPVEKINSARWVFTSQYLTILDAMQAKKMVVSVYTDELKKDYLYTHPMHANMVIGSDGNDLAEKLNSLSEIYEGEYVEKAYAWAKDQTWENLTDKYLRMWAE